MRYHIRYRMRYRVIVRYSMRYRMKFAISHVSRSGKKHIACAISHAISHQKCDIASKMRYRIKNAISHAISKNFHFYRMCQEVYFWLSHTISYTILYAISYTISYAIVITRYDIAYDIVYLIRYLYSVVPNSPAVHWAWQGSNFDCAVHWQDLYEAGNFSPSSLL